MPAERDSPSGGWRDVYHELAVDDAADPVARRADAAARRRDNRQAPFTDGTPTEDDAGPSGELEWFADDDPGGA